MMEGWWQVFKHHMEYTAYCAGADFQAPVCRTFWNWTITLAFVLAGLILFVILKQVFKEQLELYRNKKRLEARKIVADAQTMEEHRWRGDDHDIDLSEEELATEIKKAKIQMQTSIGKKSRAEESHIVTVRGYLRLSPAEGLRDFSATGE